MYNVSKSTISSIYNGTSWKYLYDKFSDGCHKNIKYSDDIIKKARNLIKENKKSMKEISDITNINLSYLYYIKLNKYRKDK